MGAERYWTFLVSYYFVVHNLTDLPAKKYHQQKEHPYSWELAQRWMAVSRCAMSLHSFLPNLTYVTNLLHAGSSLAIGCLVVFVLFLTSLPMYARHCFKISVLLSFFLCAMSLIVTANVRSTSLEGGGEIPDKLFRSLRMQSQNVRNAILRLEHVPRHLSVYT